jgi:hypothetical protein
MAKPIETLSPTDEAIFRTATLKSLQGAAEDPERIGAEYLPEIIPVDYVTLQESTTVLPSGSIALNGGLLAVHDGERAGGKKIFPSDGRIRIAYKSTSNSTANTSVKIGSFVLPADLAVNGTKIKIRGRINFIINGASIGDSGLAISFLPEPAFDAAPAGGTPTSIGFCSLDIFSGTYNLKSADMQFVADFVLTTTGTTSGYYKFAYDSTAFNPAFMGLAVADDYDTDPGILKVIDTPVNEASLLEGPLVTEQEIYVVAEWTASVGSPMSPVSISGELEIAFE